MIKSLAAVVAISVVTLTGFASQAHADSEPQVDSNGKLVVVCVKMPTDNEYYGAETAYQAWVHNYIGTCEPLPV